jgi:hypothetical protein
MVLGRHMGVLMAFDSHSFEFISLPVATDNELYIFDNPYVFLCTGLPEALDEEALTDEIISARTNNVPETTRAAAPRAADEGARQSQLSDTDIETLRGRFPILAELSTGFIRGLSAAELLSLEKASFKQRESEKFKDAEEKLASNRINLCLHCSEVKAGHDDRWTRLHEARFLAGAGCSATKLWLTHERSSASMGTRRFQRTTCRRWGWPAL